jgi:flagellar motor component MotA
MRKKAKEALMKSNMGRADRTVRLIAAAVFALLLILGIVEGTLAIVLAFVAAIFFITTFVGICPAYVPFGISTKGKGEDKDDTACEA